MSDIRKVQHLVGIDFGDGETTASIISFDPEKRKNTEVRSLNIFNIGTPNRQKVESCIFQKPDGTWELACNDEDFSNPTLKTHFKNMPSELLKQKNDIKDKKPEYEQWEFQLKTFVKLVFDRILDNNESLTYNPETKEKNFYLIAACPSKWAKSPSNPSLEDDQEIMAYKSLLNEVIPVDAVIKESDAAFYHFISQESFPLDGSKSLVIDYGSSTIDYTLFCIHDGGKSAQSDGSNVRDLGASNVEVAIQEYLETTPGTMEDFQTAKDKWEELCQRHHVTDAHWEPAIRHNLKQAKEGYYGSGHGVMRLNTPLKTIWDRGLTNEEVKELKPYYFYDTKLHETDIEDETTGCLKNYKESVRVEFLRIAEKWSPDHIIISGGASRMHWIKKEVMLAFNLDEKNVKVDTDTPSYIVSHGCAQYLLAYRSFMLKFDDLEIGIANADYMSNIKVRTALNESFNASLKIIMEKRANEIVQAYVNSETNAPFEVLAQRLYDFEKNPSDYLTESDFLFANIKTSDYLSDYYSSKVSDRINEVFKDSFGIPIKIPINLKFNDYYDRGIDVETDLEQKRKHIQQAYSETSLVTAFFPDFVLMSRERTMSERRSLAEHLSNEYILNPNNDFSKEIASIKNTVKDSVSALRAQIPFTLYG